MTDVRARDLKVIRRIGEVSAVIGCFGARFIIPIRALNFVAFRLDAQGVTRFGRDLIGWSRFAEPPGM
jgi:hypothetical protein